MTTLVDNLVAAKIAKSDNGPSYSSDPAAALAAVEMFTRQGGRVELTKAGTGSWRAAAQVSEGATRHAYEGPLPWAICKAMLKTLGVDVSSFR